MDGSSSPAAVVTGAVIERKTRVFISYARDDGLEFADQLFAALEGCGIEPLIDLHGIASAEDWRAKLGVLIASADQVVFVVTPKSVKSDMCQWELEEADRGGKRVIPLIAVQGTAAPGRLAAANYIHFASDAKLPGSGFGHGLAKLLAALKTDLGWLKEHTRLLERAREWDAKGRAPIRLLTGSDIDDAKAWAAARPANAPEITALHLEFFAASERAEAARNDANLQQIAENKRAQAEREEALAQRAEALKREGAAQKQKSRVQWAATSIALAIAAFEGVQWREAAIARNAADQATIEAKQAAVRATAEAKRADEERANAEKERQLVGATRQAQSGFISQIIDTLEESGADELTGFGSIYRNLVAIFREQQSRLLADDPKALKPLEQAKAHLRLGRALDSDGDGGSALEEYRRAFEITRDALQNAASKIDYKMWEQFCHAITLYTWQLISLQNLDEAGRIFDTYKQLLPDFEGNISDASTWHATSRTENALSRYLGARQRNSAGSLAAQERAILFMKRAIDAAPQSQRYRIGLSVYQRNLSIALRDIRPDEAKSALDSSCSLIEREATESPHLASAQRQISHCIERSIEQLPKTDEFSVAQAIAGPHLARLRSALAVDRANVPLRTALLRISGALADHAGYLTTTADGKARHQLLLRELAADFLEMVKGRRLLVEDPRFPSNIYDRFTRLEFDSVAERVKFFRDFHSAMLDAFKAFPQVTDYAYIAGDAALQTGETLRKLAGTDIKKRSEARDYLNQSVEAYKLSRSLSHTEQHSEKFDRACRTYGQRAALSAEEGDFNALLSDVEAIRRDCLPVLAKYPFDFYLRQHIDSAEMRLGELAFKQKRYEQALPSLEYASRWALGDSTKLLAEMYANGWGVSRDEKKAEDLRKLAAGQTMKRFTVPADFNGTKHPFHVYIRDWPTEFPFLGIDDQAKWLKEARGGVIAEDILESFRKLQRIARENKVSFPDLAVYALGTADKDKKAADEPAVVRPPSQQDMSRPACATC